MAFNRSLAFAVLSVAVIGVSGCERSDASREAAIRNASIMMEGNNPAGAAKTLAEAFPDSPRTGVQIQTASFAGDAHMSVGNSELAKALPAQLRAEAILTNIRQLGSAMSSLTILAQGYAAYDVSAVKNEISKMIADAQGGPGGEVWIKTGDQTLPTLAAVRQDVSRLQAEIAKRQESIDTLKKRREAIQKQAGDVANRADAAQNREAVDLYTEASNLRKQASDQSAKIDEGEAQLAPFASDLEGAQALQAVVEAHIAALNQQLKDATAGYQSLREAGGEHLTLAKSVAKKSGQQVLTDIDTRADELSKELKALEDASDAALKAFLEADKAYEVATSGATALKVDKSPIQQDSAEKNRPVAQAIGTLLEAFPTALQMQDQGMAKMAQANALAAKARILQQRLDVATVVAPAYKQAGVSTPDVLKVDGLADEVQKARDEAKETWKKAVETLTNAASALNGSDRRRSTIAAAAVTATFGYSHYLGEIGDAKGEAEQLAEARRLADEVYAEAEGKGAAPSLPDALTKVLVPSTQPAAQ